MVRVAKGSGLTANEESGKIVVLIVIKQLKFKTISVDNKHIAAILLGAAAAFGAYKYSNLTDEEKQKMKDNLKDKFHKLKDEAESGAESAKNYFNDLKDKATTALKEHFPDVEKHFDEFFKKGDNTSAAAETSTPSGV